MTLTQLRPATETPQQSGRRFGYLVSIAINATLLLIVTNLLDWGWFPWITPEFDRVVGWISFSIVATLLVNAMYLSYDRPAFKAVSQAALNAVTFVVAMRVYRIFPFDFSSYDGPWTGLTEAILVISMVGAAIGAVLETGKFFVRLNRAPSWEHSER